MQRQKIFVLLQLFRLTSSPSSCRGLHVGSISAPRTGSCGRGPFRWLRGLATTFTEPEDGYHARGRAPFQPSGLAMNASDRRDVADQIEIELLGRTWGSHDRFGGSYCTAARKLGFVPPSPPVVTETVGVPRLISTAVSMSSRRCFSRAAIAMSSRLVGWAALGGAETVGRFCIENVALLADVDLGLEVRDLDMVIIPSPRFSPQTAKPESIVLAAGLNRSGSCCQPSCLAAAADKFFPKEVTQKQATPLPRQRTSPLSEIVLNAGARCGS